MDLLFDVEYEVEDRRCKSHAHEVECLVIDRKRVRDVGEAQERQGKKDEAGEEEEPLREVN